MAELNGVHVDIFEQQASLGGCWNYSNDPCGVIEVPQTNAHQPLEKPIWRSNDQRSHSGEVDGADHATFNSPMYESLETNIPHCLMRFSDAGSLEDNQLFPTRESVTRYLEYYGEEVKHLVHFQTQVTNVQRGGRQGQHYWSVKTQNLLYPDRISSEEYDAVIVANGHYTIPRLPDINGIRHWHKINPGIISHSKFYRRPAPFANKKVVVIGNSASAIDIASQIAKVSRQPLLNSTRSDPVLACETFCKTVPEIIEFLPPDEGDRAVRYADGRIESNIDAVLFCTGYYYSFPFLSSLSPEIISSGDRVQHLYKQIFYIPDPTLVFVGLPYKTIPFRTVEGQSAAISRVWSRRLNLPSEAEMRRWEEKRIAECGAGRTFHALPDLNDFKYYNDLISWASSACQEIDGKLPPKWTKKDAWLRKRFPAIKKAFADKGAARQKVGTVEELGFHYKDRLEGHECEDHLL